jgi:hypothetical protein
MRLVPFVGNNAPITFALTRPGLQTDKKKKKGRTVSRPFFSGA